MDYMKISLTQSHNRKALHTYLTNQDSYILSVASAAIHSGIHQSSFSLSTLVIVCKTSLLTILLWWVTITEIYWAQFIMTQEYSYMASSEDETPDICNGLWKKFVSIVPQWGPVTENN